jgi:hypothetical protein
MSILLKYQFFINDNNEFSLYQFDGINFILKGNPSHINIIKSKNVKKTKLVEDNIKVLPRIYTQYWNGNKFEYLFPHECDLSIAIITPQGIDIGGKTYTSNHKISKQIHILPVIDANLLYDDTNLQYDQELKNIYDFLKYNGYLHYLENHILAFNKDKQIDENHLLQFILTKDLTSNIFGDTVILSGVKKYKIGNLDVVQYNNIKFIKGNNNIIKKYNLTDLYDLDLEINQYRQTFSSIQNERLLLVLDRFKDILNKNKIILHEDIQTLEHILSKYLK